MNFISLLFNDTTPKTISGPSHKLGKIISQDIHQIKVKIKLYNESTGTSPLYRHMYELLDKDHARQISLLQKRHNYNVAASNTAYHDQLVALKRVHANELLGFLDVMTNNYTLGQVRRVFAPTTSSDISNIDKQSTRTSFSSSALSSIDDNAPYYMLDPISLDILNDPVITPSGITYEKATLIECMQKNGNKDPITKKPLTTAELAPNLAIKDVVRDFLEDAHHRELDL